MTQRHMQPVTSHDAQAVAIQAMKIVVAIRLTKFQKVMIKGLFHN